MKILDELKIEIDRLIIAGSKFAYDDVRIKKFVPTFEKLGERAPVMKKLAVLLAELYSADPNSSPEILMKTGVFLYSVMYTQGVSVPESTSPENSAADGKDSGEPIYLNKIPDTKLPYSKLKPLMWALGSAISGRMDIIESAFNENEYNDFRLYPYYAAALDEKNSQVCLFIGDNIIPAIGENMVPFLLDTFDMQGGVGDYSRLYLLDSLGYDGIGDLVNMCLNGDCSEKVKIMCLLLLSKSAENEEYLLNMTNDKKATLREAAYTSLVMMKSKRGMEKMLDCLKSSKYKNVIQAAGKCTDEDVNDRIIDIIAECYDEYFGSSKKEDTKMGNLFSILQFKTSPKAYELIGRISVHKFGYDILPKFHKIHITMSDRCLDSDVDFYEKFFTTPSTNKRYIQEEFFEYYFPMAIKKYSKEKVYDIFADYYLNIYSLRTSGLRVYGYGYLRSKQLTEFDIDERWFELIFQKKDIGSVLAATRRKDSWSEKTYRSLWEFLRTYVKECKDFDWKKIQVTVVIIIRTMLRSDDEAEYEKNAEVIVNFLNDYLDNPPEHNMIQIILLGVEEAKAARLFNAPKYVTAFENIMEKIKNSNVSDLTKSETNKTIVDLFENIKELNRNGE
ncbi:MAG: HEAT repeat domain-containing protein [Ruminococcus sp.]|jgi:hypothetical protein|nr:HEAT repeat domain-containing protein [Ruminococcus sp.]